LKSKFFLRELGGCHYMLCLFVWGSYWKLQVSPPITNESSKEWSSFTDWINSWKAWSLIAFCSSVKQCEQT
jgi:hypothetical protein